MQRNMEKIYIISQNILVKKPKTRHHPLPKQNQKKALKRAFSKLLEWNSWGGKKDFFFVLIPGKVFYYVFII